MIKLFIDKYMYFSNITEQDCSNTQETLSFIVNALVHFSRKLDDQGTTLEKIQTNLEYNRVSI